MFEEDLKYSYAYTLNPKIRIMKSREKVEKWLKVKENLDKVAEDNALKFAKAKKLREKHEKDF